MKQNKFDMVMDYIDANISNDTETIKKGIFNLINYNSNTFGQCFSVLTGDTLFHYICERRLYFAAKDLRSTDKTICDIALDYGYSEQSAFTRAMKTYYGCTPSEVKKGKASMPNNKYRFADFCNKNSDMRTQRILRALENDEDISLANIELLEDLNEASKEYGFDIDTCSAIADLAERLEIPARVLLTHCFELIAEMKADPYFLPPEAEAAIDCGIKSKEEMEDICAFFNCKYYDLDSFMVDAYREMKKE